MTFSAGFCASRRSRCISTSRLSVPRIRCSFTRLPSCSIDSHSQIRRCFNMRALDEPIWHMWNSFRIFRETVRKNHAKPAQALEGPRASGILRRVRADGPPSEKAGAHVQAVRCQQQSYRQASAAKQGDGLESFDVNLTLGKRAEDNFCQSSHFATSKLGPRDEASWSVGSSAAAPRM